jgi:hypothetical protein
MTPGFTPGLTPTNFASDFGKGQREGGLTMDPNNGAFFWRTLYPSLAVHIRVAANANIALLLFILTLSYLAPLSIYNSVCIPPFPWRPRSILPRGRLEFPLGHPPRNVRLHGPSRID